MLQNSDSSRMWQRLKAAGHRPTIGMFLLLAVSHFGWMKLQKIEGVGDTERPDFPLFRVSKWATTV